MEEVYFVNLSDIARSLHHRFSSDNCDYKGYGDVDKVVGMKILDACSPNGTLPGIDGRN
jgi:hypothetical protein